MPSAAEFQLLQTQYIFAHNTNSNRPHGALCMNSVRCGFTRNRIQKTASFLISRKTNRETGAIYLILKINIPCRNSFRNVNIGDVGFFY